MNVLVIDVGGTHIKFIVSGQTAHRKFASGHAMTAEQMVAGIKRDLGDWTYDACTVGYPGPVVDNHPELEPHNLGPGWVGFDYEQALGCPVKFVNDAAMQALGSYRGGRMLFLGFGTGLGTALIVEGILHPLELGHLPYRKRTYEDYVGAEGLERYGKKKWRKLAADVIRLMIEGVLPDDVVLGGGNAKLLQELPPKCRLGSNDNAFLGGFRMWQDDAQNRSAVAAAV